MESRLSFSRSFGQFILKLNVILLYNLIDDRVRIHENELKSYIPTWKSAYDDSFIYI